MNDNEAFDDDVPSAIYTRGDQVLAVQVTLE
jgi:hypothetical protein